MTREIKLLEIRDDGTFIPAMAIQVSGDDGYLMRRAGFGAPMIYLVALSVAQCQYDPYGWSRARTMPVAHEHIANNWETLEDGDVVDVQFILGEALAPKLSESLMVPS